MNIVVSWILKHTQTSSGQIEEGRHKLHYNESDAFYFLVYIMDKLQYKEVFSPDQNLLQEKLITLSNLILGCQPELYDKFSECGCELSMVFTKIYMTMFVGALQSKHP